MCTYDIYIYLSISLSLSIYIYIYTHVCRQSKVSDRLCQRLFHAI